MSPLHRHPGYLAFLGHRLSGLALAAFLPLHFLLLAGALEDAEGLDRLLVYTELAPVRIAEWGLVVLLALHLLFGLRLLLLEFSGSGRDYRGWILPAATAALLVGVVFVVRTL